MRVNLMVAACEGSMGIGKNGGLPWTGMLRKEMKYFARMTSDVREEGRRNAVVMGRKTYESIPAKFRPLKNRLNVVLTRQDEYDPGSDDVVVCSSLKKALSTLEAKSSSLETVWVIGGSSVYAESLPSCDRVYLTRVKKEFDCDAFFPALDPAEFAELEEGADPRVPAGTQEEDGVEYKYAVLERKKTN